MATGRTVLKNVRAYIDGYDLSGFSRSIGPLAWTFDQEEGTVFTDPVKGALPGHVDINPGTLTGNFDNTALGLHVVANGAGVKRNVMVPIGIRAAPAEGDPVFCSQNLQGEYMGTPTAGELISATVPFGMWAADGDTLLYAQPWGRLLHEKSAETAVNSATATVDHGASSALGGYMMYQLMTSNGTVTILTEDSSVNSDGNFGTLATSGVIDASSTPKSGIVALGTTATVERYLRWQIVLGTATTCTFALAFVRGYI